MATPRNKATAKKRAAAKKKTTAKKRTAAKKKAPKRRKTTADEVAAVASDGQAVFDAPAVGSVEQPHPHAHLVLVDVVMTGRADERVGEVEPPTADDELVTAVRRIIERLGSGGCAPSWGF